MSKTIEARLFGEAVVPAHFDSPMAWAPYDENGLDRITTSIFLAGWRAYGAEEYDRIGLCTINENGDFFILALDYPNGPAWVPVVDPDQILAPTPHAEPGHD